MSARYRLGLFLWSNVSLVWLYAFLFLLPPVDFAWLLIVAGVFLADAGSYVFHYVIDHYGRPVPGGVVHEFQRHHLIPNGIVEKPVSEVLYPALRLATPLLLALGAAVAAGWLPVSPALFLFVLLSCWVLAQLFHRWSHMNAPVPARLAQRLHLLISVPQHALHHTQPFDSRFAVITGWSNFVLDGLRAPVLLDWLMQRLGKKKRGLVHNLQEISNLES